MIESIGFNQKIKVLEIKLFYWKLGKETNPETTMKTQSSKNCKK